MYMLKLIINMCNNELLCDISFDLLAGWNDRLRRISKHWYEMSICWPELIIINEFELLVLYKSKILIIVPSKFSTFKKSCCPSAVNERLVKNSNHNDSRFKLSLAEFDLFDWKSIEVKSCSKLLFYCK